MWFADALAALLMIMVTCSMCRPVLWIKSVGHRVSSCGTRSVVMRRLLIQDMRRSACITGSWLIGSKSIGLENEDWPCAGPCQQVLSLPCELQALEPDE